MLPRLYLQIYLTIVASLILVVLTAAALWKSTADLSPMAQARDIVEEIVGLALPPVGEGPQATEAALRKIADRTGTDVALFAADLSPIAGVGGVLPPPDPHDRWASTPHGSTLSLHLPDGRWLVVLMPSPRRNPVVAIIFFLGAIALAVALAALPVARRITRRLERLQESVEQLGAGDFSARVEVEGRDEVARLAASFNRAAARIEDLVGAHKMLLANASHELRTPLARIRMGIELMKSDASQQAAVERDIAELDEMVGAILLASRLEALDDFGADEEVDVLALAAEECARHADCSLDGEPVTMRGDPMMLRHLLRNLLENAARHGVPPIEVGIRSAGAEVVLAVADAGTPIPAADRERLFEPFVRVRSTASGTGIGLSLVRLIARHHGGDVAYVEEGGRGRFEVRMPIDRRGTTAGQVGRQESGQSS
jgi:signal transduction histidine kinase